MSHDLIHYVLLVTGDPFFNKLNAFYLLIHPFFSAVVVDAAFFFSFNGKYTLIGHVATLE